MSLISLRRFAAMHVWFAFGLFGCGDNRVAGTSSGVDNPQLTLAFHDSTGLALRVTGDLNLYSQDQNPAVDPEPLWTLKLKASDSTNLTSNDIERISTSDSVLHFNLQLKTENQTGILNFGLTYNSKTKVFSQLRGGALSRLEMKPKPLVHYQAHVSGPTSKDQLSRMYIPGTPFQATLVDSVFFFEDLPPGVFPLRLLEGDGQIFPVAESLNTNGARIFTPGQISVGKVDTSRISNLDSLLGIQAGPPREAFIEIPSLLLAKVVNVDPANPRLSILWRQIPLPGDSLGNRVVFSDPTNLSTEIRFAVEGVYYIEVSATLGLFTKKSKTVISVRHIPPPQRPRVVLPRPNDSIPLGAPYQVMWEMPDTGNVWVRLSLDAGKNWITLADSFKNPDGIPVFDWTPAASLSPSNTCLLQVRLLADTLKTAQSTGFFSLIPKRPP